jgi:D-alanine-D-alanine ligase
VRGVSARANRTGSLRTVFIAIEMSKKPDKNDDHTGCRRGSLKIGLVYDLRDDYLAEGYTEEQVAEFDSESTIRSLEDALKSLGHQVARVGNGRALAGQLAAGARWDLVFNIAEGLAGRSREAQVPALLEMYGVPYTFSDPLVCALTLDKGITKRVVRSGGVATPDFFVVESVRDVDRIAMPYPMFAKPIAEGTGKGVDSRSCIRRPEDLRPVCQYLLERFGQPVLVERYLPGREFTTAVLGTGLDARVLGTMEIAILDGAPATDYSYEVKELCEKFVRYFPMPKGALRDETEALALKAYQILQCRDAGRVDIRLDENGRPMFIEINPLPGLHPSHSDLPMIATQEGVSYETLIQTIVEAAMRRIAPVKHQSKEIKSQK